MEASNADFSASLLYAVDGRGDAWGCGGVISHPKTVEKIKLKPSEIH